MKVWQYILMSISDKCRKVVVDPNKSAQGKLYLHNDELIIEKEKIILQIKLTKP